MLKVFHKEVSDRLCVMLMKVKDKRLRSDTGLGHVTIIGSPLWGSCNGVCRQC